MSLPKNWKESPLIDLLETLETGSRPKGGVSGILSGVPSLGGEHLNYDGGFNLDKIKYIPEHFANKMNRGLIKPGDVLIVKDGATTGKVSYVDENFPFVKAYVNEHVFICRIVSDISSKCVYYYLRSKEGQERILDNFTGSAQGGINQKFAHKTIIPVPPLGEQKRIVAKLDKLFAHHDQLKSRLEQMPVLLKQFRQAVLTQAVTGKLTEEWRKGNSDRCVKDLLVKELAKRQKLINSKQLRKDKGFGPIVDSELFYMVPNSWQWVRWNDVLALDNNSMKRGPFGSTLKKEFFVSEGIRVFEQYNPINDDPYWVRYYIKPSKFEDLKSFLAGPGDLLISCSGVTLGRITELPNDVESGIINQALLKLTLNKNLVLNQYFLKLFRSKFIQDQIFDQAQGTAIPNMVGVNELRRMPLPIPTIEEQKEIVRRVDSLFALADKIEARYNTLKEKIDQLPQAILAKAFKGELVEQDELAKVKKYKDELSDLAIAAEP